MGTLQSFDNHAIAPYLTNFTETDPLFSYHRPIELQTRRSPIGMLPLVGVTMQFNGIRDHDGIETLTNKTLTSPVINSPTGLVKADVGLSEVDNTSDLLKPISVQHRRH